MPTHYLTGQRSPSTDRISAYHKQNLGETFVGLLVTPKTIEYLRTPTIVHYNGIGIDNGRFSADGKRLFTWELFERLVKIAKAQVQTGDLKEIFFVACPDEPMDWAETYKMAVSEGGLRRINSWGAPASLVIQGKRGSPDFATPDNIPWGLVDSIFIGGDDWYKESPHAAECVQRAKELGKQVHMGRVNTPDRMRLAWEWGVDSADGTYLMQELAKAAQKVIEENPKGKKEPQEEYDRRIMGLLYDEGGYEEDVANDPFKWTYQNIWRDRWRIAQRYVKRHGSLPLVHLAQMELRGEIPRPFSGDGWDEDILEYEEVDGVEQVKVVDGRVINKQRHHARDISFPYRDWGLKDKPDIKDLRRRGILPR